MELIIKRYNGGWIEIWDEEGVKLAEHEDLLECLIQTLPNFGIELIIEYLDEI